MRKIIIIGYAAGGIEAVEYIRTINARQPTWEIVGFFDEKISTGAYRDVPVLGAWDWLQQHMQQDFEFICTIGNPVNKKRIVARLTEEYRARFATIVHPTVVAAADATIGVGTIIAPYCIIQPLANVGNHIFCGGGTYIGHDAAVGDFTALNPHAIISGQVRIEPMAYIGTGATIIQNLHLGAGCVVAAGSAVFNDVPAETSVAGVPARAFYKK